MILVKAGEVWVIFLPSAGIVSPRKGKLIEWNITKLCSSIASIFLKISITRLTIGLEMLIEVQLLSHLN